MRRRLRPQTVRPELQIRMTPSSSTPSLSPSPISLTSHSPPTQHVMWQMDRWSRTGRRSRPRRRTLTLRPVHSPAIRSQPPNVKAKLKANRRQPWSHAEHVGGGADAIRREGSTAGGWGSYLLFSWTPCTNAAFRAPSTSSAPAPTIVHLHHGQVPCLLPITSYLVPLPGYLHPPTSSFPPCPRQGQLVVIHPIAYHHVLGFSLNLGPGPRNIEEPLFLPPLSLSRALVDVLLHPPTKCRVRQGTAGGEGHEDRMSAQMNVCQGKEFTWHIFYAPVVFSCFFLFFRIWTIYHYMCCFHWITSDMKSTGLLSDWVGI